jgi:hypothetical protein
VIEIDDSDDSDDLVIIEKFVKVIRGSILITPLEWGCILLNYFHKLALVKRNQRSGDDSDNPLGELIANALKFNPYSPPFPFQSNLS